MKRNLTTHPKSTKNRINKKVKEVFPLNPKSVEDNTNFINMSYKMNLEYNTKSTNINVITITYFEKYEYWVEVYEFDISDENQCFPNIIEMEPKEICKPNLLCTSKISLSK